TVGWRRSRTRTETWSSCTGSGGGGIRTHEALADPPVFKSSAEVAHREVTRSHNRPLNGSGMPPEAVFVFASRGLGRAQSARQTTFNSADFQQMPARAMLDREFRGAGSTAQLVREFPGRMGPTAPRRSLLTNICGISDTESGFTSHLPTRQKHR